MLIGTYRHSLDAKNRMRMPSKLKADVGVNFIITKGTNKNLFVFSKSDFDEIYKKLTNNYHFLHKLPKHLYQA